MKIVTIARTPVAPAVIPWPVGTVARVRRKGTKKHPDGYLRMHVLVGVPAGANVDADNSRATAGARSAALNLATGSIKGYALSDYDVLEVFDATLTVS